MAIVNLSGYYTSLQNISIQGPKGSGKTSLAMHLAENILSNNKLKLFVFADNSVDAWKDFCTNIVMRQGTVTEAKLTTITGEAGAELSDFYDKEVASGAERDWLVVFDCTDVFLVDIERLVPTLLEWQRLCTSKNVYIMFITNNEELIATSGISTQTFKSLSGSLLYEFYIKKNNVTGVHEIQAPTYNRD